MSFVKITGEGSGEASAETSVEGLPTAPIKAAGAAATGGDAAGALGDAAGAFGDAAGAVAKVTGAGAAVGQGGVGQVAATVGGIAAASSGVGGTVGGIVGAAAGGPAGVVGGIAGAVAGVAGATGGIAGAVGSIAGAAGPAGGIAGAVGSVAGAVGGVAGAVGAIAGAVGSVTAAAGGIAGVAGGLAGGAGDLTGSIGGGSPSGGIAGFAGAHVSGIAGGELPFFEDKAITSTIKKAATTVTDQLGDAIEQIGGMLAGKLTGQDLEVEVASGDELDIRQFSVHERMSSLFQVQLIVVTQNPDLDFDAIVGLDAKFSIQTVGEPRRWTGICNHLQQIAVESDGLSTYQLSIVPRLWLATQRRNHRMFQQISEPDIVLELLKEWKIEPELRIDSGAYKKRKYRVQYGESDFAFLSRMLEDAGISFHFEQMGGESKLVLSDAPQKNKPRPLPLRFFDSPTGQPAAFEHATHVRVGQLVRPGKYTMRDHDYRLPPSYKLLADHTDGKGVEAELERFHYTPGAFLFGTDKGEPTPVADDRGRTRTDQAEATKLAQKRLDAKRTDAKVISFETNVPDIAPGMVLSFLDHPRSDLGNGKKLLIVETVSTGSSTGDWHKSCEARSADLAYRPPLVTPKPKVAGIESATVVGPPGEEIHTDEFGRVRVHFHWDRESEMNEKSSCWIHVSQPWGGTGYGGINLPRVGQEVIVDFLGGDPDRPVIVGRLYTNLQKVPYRLPQDKTKSGWKSHSSPNGGADNYNEISFEDKKGQELINIQAERDLAELVKHDATHTVRHNRTLTVGNNDTASVGVLHSVTITPPPPAGMGPPAPPTTSVTMIDKKIVLTTKEATITIDGPNITLDADTNITLESRGTIDIKAKSGIKMKADSGDIVVRGDPKVKINCSE